MKDLDNMSKEELLEALPEILKECAQANDFDFVLTRDVDDYCDRIFPGAERQIVVSFDWSEIALPKEEYWKSEYQEVPQGSSIILDETERMQSENGSSS